MAAAFPCLRLSGQGERPLKKIRILFAFIFAFILVVPFALAAKPLSALANDKEYQTIVTVPDRIDTEYINYSRKESTKNFFILPSYTCSFNKSACGPVSAAIITAYYAVSCPALFPGFTPHYYSPTDGRIIFYSSHAKIDWLLSSYITIMSVSVGNGVTVARYKQGISDYFSIVAGLTVTLGRQVLTNGSLHFQGCVTALDAGRPVALFMSYYNIAILGTPQDGQDKLIQHVYINNHIVTACGYEIIKYYRIENGVEKLFRTDNYLAVQTGWGYAAWMYVGSNFTAHDAYSVWI